MRRRKKRLAKGGLSIQMLTLIRRYTHPEQFGVTLAEYRDAVNFLAKIVPHA